jgi:RimJ/RimL family protein N-acetyltransferase
MMGIDPPFWYDGLPRLTGSLVHLREVVSADAPLLFELLSDPAVTEHISPPPPSVEKFAGFIRWAHQQRSEGRSVTYGIVPRGLETAVGILQLRALDPTWIAAEWGFAVGAAFWGTGLFAEAARLTATFAFEQMHVDRIEARAAVTNGRGNGALHKMGAAAESCLARSLRRPDGGYEDQLLWSLRAEDWRCRDDPFARGRFDAAAAKRAIRERIQAVQNELARDSATTPADDASFYPFLLTVQPKS